MLMWMFILPYDKELITYYMLDEFLRCKVEYLIAFWYLCKIQYNFIIYDDFSSSSVM